MRYFSSPLGTYLLNSVRIPRYSYNSSSSTLTFQPMSSTIHQSLLWTISQGYAAAHLSLPPSFKSRIRVVRNARYGLFEGIYTGSKKVPDLALGIKNNMGVGEVKFVAEVRFSESYEELVQDAKLWLGGNGTVSLVMLVKLGEDPCYRSIQNLTESEFSELEFPPIKKIEDQPFTITGPYGPVEYKGFKWVGEISGLLEFWMLDPVTRLASHIMTRMVSNPLKNLSYPSLPI